MTRLIIAACPLLAALPSTFAQSPVQPPKAISILTGPVAAGVTASGVFPPLGAALVGTGNAKPVGSTVSINMGPVRANATGTGGALPAQSGAPGSQNVWVIRVGNLNGTLAFSPNTITGAQVGDQLQFQFYPQNHSVVMGDYNNACQPVQNSANAFFSGFMPTTAEGQLTYTVPVKSTDPMWMYCSFGKHCQEGMVAVVNPPATGQTLQDYKQRAAQAQQNVSPSGAASGGSSGSGSGQIGQTPSGPTTSGPAQQTSANTATSNLRVTSWSLAAVAAFAVLIL